MTFPTDTEVAGWVSKLYQGPAGFDHIVQVDPLAPYVGIKLLADGSALIIPRGSTTWQDWFRDLDSERPRIIPGYETFGPVPFGFGDFALATYMAICALVGSVDTWIIGCHSLACPEGIYQALIRLVAGKKVSKLVLCAPPNPGTAKLAALWASFQVPISAYWNKGDIVETLPVPAPLADLPWGPICPFRFINVPPASDDLDLLFRCHHMNLYLTGVTAYENKPISQ